MNATELRIGTGTVMAAAPMMRDPNFSRTVVLLCAAVEDGAFGLVINRRSPYQSEDLNALLHYQDTPLSFGGPVDPTALHFLHDIPDVIPGSQPLMDGVHWGGDFSVVQALAGSNELANTNIRFFLGYAGWGPGQLEEEISSNDWIICRSDPDVVFGHDPDSIWRIVLERLGGHYAMLSNFPVDPRLN